MFASLGRISYRHRWPVLIAFLVLLPVAAVIGGGAFAVLSPGGFEDPTAESIRARELLADRLDTGGADLIALYTVAGGSIDDPEVRAAVTAVLAQVAHDPSVERVTSLFNTGAPQFVSADRTRTFAVVSLRGDDAEKERVAERLEPVLAANGASVQFGGSVPAGTAINKAVEGGLTRAELIAFPVTAVLLFFIFGSLVSATVPLVLGALAILLAFAALRVMATFTDVSIFAINVVTVLGLGLAI